MPVGVPKVPFRLPGDEDPSWVDLYNGLYLQRLLFLFQDVEGEISNQIVGLIVYLTIQNPRNDLYLFIHSPGGWIMSGVAIYDMMHSVQPDVQTICLGIAASTGSFILVGGTITKRSAFSHARVMIHQPHTSFYESPIGEFVLETDEILSLREIVTKAYAQRTRKPLWVITEDIERDTFMSATEAQAYGIVDLVVVA